MCRSADESVARNAEQPNSLPSWAADGKQGSRDVKDDQMNWLNRVATPVLVESASGGSWEGALDGGGGSFWTGGVRA